MAEKLVDGEKGLGSGKEGGSSKTSLRSLLPHSNSKEASSSPPGKRSSGRFIRTSSQQSASVDSDVDGQTKPDQTSGSRTDPDSPASQDNSDGGVKLVIDNYDDGTDKDSTVDSDTSKDKEKRKETTRFFSSPKMRGTMFPFDQISVPMSSHRQKNIELHRIFSSLDNSEKLIDDFSCALQRDILVHGRLYVTQNWLCFYANIFTWETLLTIPFMSVTAITKERTAFVFPTAIQITTTAEKYGFSSLMSRDVTYNVLFKVWQNSLLNEHLSPLELVKAARRAAGDAASKEITEDELWGDSVSKSGSNPSVTQPKGKMSLPGVRPTHVEIIHSTENHTPFTKEDINGTGESIGEGVSGGLYSEGNVHLNARKQPHQPRHTGDQEEMNGDYARSATQSVSHDGVDHQNLSTPMTPGGGEFPERISMGGESLGSYSEFETVSFADESGEIPCGCADHVGRTMINNVYAADVETIFQLLFTDSDFYREFFKSRKTINIEIGEWQEQTDGSKLRDLKYTVALNYSFGPKFSPTSEHQVYSNTAQPGLKHLVHTEVLNHNIPYADTFFVSCQYCMTRVAHDKTRLRITSNINFRKSCWGVVKNLIEKNAGDGVRTHYNHLDTFLKEHLATLPARKSRRQLKRQRRTSRPPRHKKVAQVQPPPSPPPLVSHQQSQQEDNSPPSLPSSPVPTSKPTHPSTSSLYSFQLNGSTPTTPDNHFSQQSKRSSSSFPQVNMALTLLLGILIISNMALYHHLMSYQSTSTKGSVTDYSHTEYLEWPTSDEEWISLTRRHLESHEAEKQQWLDVLATLFTTLEQVESSLSVAKRVITEHIETTSNYIPHPQSAPPPKSHSSTPSLDNNEPHSEKITREL